MKMIPQGGFEQARKPEVMALLCSVTHAAHTVVDEAARGDAQDQRRFEAICARELLGEID
ncbi:hypothetical protein [Sphingomonas sp. G-3-2-10]|uniref:hypothetical protein n=1 Tax=Sphingomonas sp. G-3-2-10 TaxID=2728838 RepID=UPI00146BFDCA|nr:hypothetical protein [Sphingomonas sp. G-3-2-10]NML07810.1 hypothetical protein [Sphingomonas sp. G-3-2-10]